MWASSKVEFLNGLMPGANVRRVSRVKSIAPKIGNSGELVFVGVEHETFSGELLSIREVQTLVYREASSAAIPLPEETEANGAPTEHTIVPTPQLLFRYSAMTFNTHRIHYDEAYAQTVEGYPRLVVHGPLMASLILRAASSAFGAKNIATFSFRGKAPAFCGQRLKVEVGGLCLLYTSPSPRDS